MLIQLITMIIIRKTILYNFILILKIYQKTNLSFGKSFNKN